MKKVFLIATLVSFASTASAEQKFDTVGDMLGACREAVEKPGQIKSMPAGYCIGVISGVSQTLLTSCSSNRKESAKIPNGLTMARPKGQYPMYAAAQGFINWAEDNPDKWDTPFTLAAIISLPLAFPCQK